MAAISLSSRDFRRSAAEKVEPCDKGEGRCTRVAVPEVEEFDVEPDGFDTLLTDEECVEEDVEGPRMCC